MRIRAVVLLSFLMLFIIFAVAAPSYAATDQKCHWTCNYNTDNNRIEVSVGADYGALDCVSAHVRWQETPDGTWTDLISASVTANSPISKFFTPGGARDGTRYLVQADFSKGGAIIDSESQLITWGDANSGTNGSGDNPIPAVVKDKDGGPFVDLISYIIDGITIAVDYASKSLLGTKSIGALVFNAGLSDQDRNFTPFTTLEMDMIWTWYKALAAGSFVLILIAIVVTAFKFAAAPFSVLLREDAVASMWRWLCAILIIAGAPFFYYAMVKINNGLVDLFLSIANQVSPGKGIDAMFLDPGSKIQTGYILSTSIVKLIFSFVNLYLAILYALRKLILIVILIFTPIMAWLWALNKNVNAAQIWLSEILSNIFMQTAHAFVFLILMSFITLGNNEQANTGLTGNPNALGASLLDLLTNYGVPIGGAVLFASVCWVAVQIITSRFNPGRREGVMNNLLYVGAGGIILGGVMFFASLALGIAQKYFGAVF